MFWRVAHPSVPLFLSRSGTLGAPSLRSLQGRVRCCRYYGVCYAQRLASQLRRPSPRTLSLVRATGDCLCLVRAQSRNQFLSILDQTRLRHRFVVVGYVVMPEHIHLLLTEPEVGTPSTVMQVLKTSTYGRRRSAWKSSGIRIGIR